jgi:alpha-L-fucosidase
MGRRRVWLAVAAAGALGPCALAGPEDSLPRPTPVQAAWHDLEVGMFIHIAPQTWQDSETDDLSTPLSAINPEKLDTDQWVRVAESMGARSVVFVAKHEGGFCWWQTRTTDFSVRNTPWRDGKGDVLADLSRSCAARGMKLGVYLSPQDRKHGIGVGGTARDPGAQDGYVKLFREQLTEVLTRYGEMSEVWFDGSLVFDVGDILAAHAKNAVIFQGPQATIRWVGNEDGIAPYPAWNGVRSGARKWGDYTAADGDPAGDRWLPNECDARIRATWFWKTTNQDTLKSVSTLMDMYEKSVGRGAVLLLNNTPDRSGLIPEADARRSAEFGAEIERRYGAAGAEGIGRGAEVVVRPPAPIRTDRVVIMEDIAAGERVRRYVVEGLVGGEWKALAEGTAIGHKRIERFAAVEVAAVRLRCLEAVGEPQIRRFAVYRAIGP